MIRVSHLIAVIFKRVNPLHKRKESSFAKQTTRKLRLDALESRNLLSCVGFADPGVLAESPESSIVECRATEAIATTRDVNVIYFELDATPFCGPLPKEAHEALMRRIQMGNAVSAAESEAIVETHSDDNTLEQIERVKPLGASQASIKQFNFDAEALDVGGTTYSLAPEEAVAIAEEAAPAGVRRREAQRLAAERMSTARIILGFAAVLEALVLAGLPAAIRNQAFI